MRRAEALGQAQVPRHAVHLRLVEMRDRLDVGRAVAVLDEEALVVLQPVRRADHGVVEPVGVEVFERLADALLEVGGGDDLQVFGEAELAFDASRRPATATRRKRLMRPSCRRR